METDFSEQMKEIAQDMEDTIDEMELADEMYIGESSIQGLINGTASMKSQLIAEYREMGREALAAYKREAEQKSPLRKFHDVGRYNIQGIIGGAETEKPKLAAAYEDAARLAYDKEPDKLYRLRFRRTSHGPASQVRGIYANME